MGTTEGMHRLLTGLTATTAAGLGLWWWWRLHPTSRPFAQRVWVDTPHPFITHGRLRRALEPRPGQRILSVGVGSGRYAVPLATQLRHARDDTVGVDGAVEAVDLHLDMLLLARRRAVSRGVHNLALAAAAATALPYADDTFDAAFMVSVLGQVPDPTAALVEVRRVVRPNGRVVVGELGYDPHGVFFGELRRRARTTGLRLDVRFGGWTGYFARLIVPG